MTTQTGTDLTPTTEEKVATEVDERPTVTPYTSPRAAEREAVEAAAATKTARLDAMKPRAAEVTAAAAADRPVLIETQSGPVFAGTSPPPEAVLHLGVTAILAGEGGVGKTALAAALAVAVAAGVPWFTVAGNMGPDGMRGHDVTWAPARMPDAIGGVLIVAAEEEHAEIHRRLWSACWEAARAKAGQPPSEDKPSDKAKTAFDAIAKDVVANVQIIALADTAAEGAMLAEVVTETVLFDDGARSGSRRTVRCEKADLFNAVAEALSAKPPSGKPWRLVILDPLVELLALESENDNRQVAGGMRAGVHPLRRLVKEAPVTVLALHHTSKGGGEKTGGSEADRIRGASAFVNSARWAALLTRDRETKGWVNLDVVKANYAGRPSAILVNHKGALRGLTRDEADREAKRRADAAAEKEKEKQPRGKKPPKDPDVSPVEKPRFAAAKKDEEWKD